MRVIPINVCHEVMNTSHIQKLDKTSFFFFVGGYPQVNQRCGKATKDYVQVVFPEPVFFAHEFRAIEVSQCKLVIKQDNRRDVSTGIRDLFINCSEMYTIYIYILYEVYTHIYHIYNIYIYIECVYIIEYLYTHCTGKSALVTSYIPI